MVLQSIKLERFKAIFIKINWSDTLIKRLRHIASKSTQLNLLGKNTGSNLRKKMLIFF